MEKPFQKFYFSYQLGNYRCWSYFAKTSLLIQKHLLLTLGLGENKNWNIKELFFLICDHVFFLLMNF